MNSLKNKNILITGGVGSIGKEIINQIFEYEPNIVRIYDIDESGAFELENKLCKLSDSNFNKLRFLVGDVRDKNRLSYALDDIDIVFHTAALKHVKSCEYNPFEAVKTNIIGLQNVIDISIENNIDKVIFTSSDKAANPTNTMGATKLLGERLIISANNYRGNRKTIFSSVRFGNVLCSRGSVIPLWNEQMKNGFITLTNPDMTRFIMSINKAVELLFESTNICTGGEVFIFKMSAVKLKDLADAFVEENGNINIKTIGLKPGEKMYEELLTDDERLRAIESERMFIIFPTMNDKLGVLNDQNIITDGFNSSKTELLNKEEIKNLLKTCR